MSSQTIIKRNFGSSFGGSPILITESTAALADIIHNVSPPANSQYSMYLELHNKTSARVLIHVIWNPTSPSTVGDFTASYNIAPYDFKVIADGFLFSQLHYSGTSNGLRAYADLAGDVDKVLVQGYMLEIQQEAG